MATWVNQGARVGRLPLERPALERLDQGVLNGVLDGVEMLEPEDARQRGDHLPCAMTEQMVDTGPCVFERRLGHQPCMGWISRSSIRPP